MRKKFIKILLVFITISMSFSFEGCGNKDKYLVKDYLKDLAFYTGIENDDYLKDLLAWGVINKKDEELLDTSVTYDFVYKTIESLIPKEIDDVVGIKRELSKEEILDIIKKTCDIINNRYYPSHLEYEKNEDPLSDDFFDQYNKYEVSSSFSLDLDECEVIPYAIEDSAYKNNYYEMISFSGNGFYYKGYRISLNLVSGGIHFRVSKSISDDSSRYFDVTIRNLNPSFNWEYNNGVVEEAYLKLGFDSTISAGINKGKYIDYAFDPANSDKTSLKTYFNSVIKRVKNNEDITIPICTIKTPVPGVPLTYINLEVGIHIYANGKAEIVLNNSSCVGFEVKNNKLRLIKDFKNDLDFSISASLKTTLGINLSLSIPNYRLFDIELDGGVKAKVGTTIHLYDNREEEIIETEDDLSLIEEISKGIEDVKVCGDLSLAWVLDLKLNTYKTLLYKFGLTKTFYFFDDDDQVFGNLHHIEDGHFVKYCTRKYKKNYSINPINIDTDCITLKKYSIVLKREDVYLIEPLSLPSGYSISDLLFESSNEDVVLVIGNKIEAQKSGSSRIKIFTDDLKYTVYLNVLVSYE